MHVALRVCDGPDVVATVKYTLGRVVDLVRFRVKGWLIGMNAIATRY